MSGSTGDTVSVLNKTFARQDLSLDASVQLRQALELFIEKHSDRDDAPSPRVQEELRRICNDNLGTELSKLEGFILALTVLEPYLRTTGDLQAWFELVVTTMIDAHGTKKSLVQQTQEFVVTCVAYDKESPDAQERAKSCQTFISKLIQELLRRTAALTGGTVTTTLRSQNRAQQQLEAIAIQVGRAHPKELFSSLEEPLLAPASRFHALQFMCAWLKQQQPHLDIIADTSVFDIILKCLMNDRSTVMISVALQCLLMLLPHIPATVATQLPRLFLIYSRCLCWEKFSSSSSKAQKALVTDDRIRSDSDDEADQLFSIDPEWKVVSSVPDAPEAPAPELLCYFTYLYGLYPLNFTSYIRKPRKYLKQIDFPGAEDFDLDQAIIRSRTEQFQRAHLLHPSFFNMTPEEELADNRWLKAEPAEVVAECLGLYSGSQSMPNLPGPPPSGKLPALPVSPPMSKRSTAMSPDRLLSPASESIPASPSSASLAPSVTDSMLFKSTSSMNPDTIYLQRELAVLRNELNFERHLKQQHAAAIGQLKRDRIKAVTVEAETATLINANRSLLRKLTEATKFNEKLQKETQSRKAHARQSEDQLNAKLRSLRSALADQEALETNLKKAHDDIEVLRQLVVESESRELKTREKTESQGVELKNLEGLKAELASVRRDLQSSEGHETEMKAEIDLLRRDVEMNRTMVATHDQERERSKKAFQARIVDLESQLSATSLNGDKSDEEQTTERELEEARAKCASIQRAWIKANRELQEIRIRYDDLLRVVGNRMASGPGPSVPDDNEAYMWRGPPVGGTYEAADGSSAHSQPIHMDGGSFPSNRPFRSEAMDERADRYGILSRSEGSSGLHGAVATNMHSGETGTRSDSGAARSYGAPERGPSIFQLGSDGNDDQKLCR